MERLNTSNIDKLIPAFFLLSIFVFPCCQKHQKRDFFYTYIQSDPGKLDPFYSTDVISGRVLAKIMSGLFRIDREGSLQKDMVSSYSFNGRIFTAVLRDDIFFHNGSEVSSDDVVFSIERIWKSANPTSPRKWIFNNIKRIVPAGEKAVRIELKKASSTFLYLLTMPNSYIISKDDFINNRRITGCGPFKLSRWIRDDRIELVRNARYFKDVSEIGGIVFKIIPEDLTARFEFLNSGLDYFELPYLADVDFKKEGIRFIDVPELSVHYVALNTVKEPFSNKQFRSALNMAIDREKIMKSLFRGRFHLAAGPVPPGTGGYKTTAKPIEYNPGRAKEIFSRFPLKEREFTIFIKADHQVALITQMIQHFLSQAGLKVMVREMEWSALKAATLKGEYDMAYFTWHADYPEPENFLYPLFYSKNRGAGGNRAFFSNKEADSLLNLAGITVDTRRRYKIYERIERIIIDEAPWIFLWYGDKRIALSGRIKDFVPYSIYNGMKGDGISLR